MSPPHRADLLVIGESLVDVLAPALGPQTRAPGGSPLNVAVTAARLGSSVTIRTALGEDDDGRALRHHLAASGVRLVDGPVLERTATAIAHLGGEGAVSYDFDIAWPALGEVRADATILHTGSVAFFAAPGADDVRAALAWARREGRVTSLDPNIRPSLVGERAAVLARFEGALADLDLVKLSEEDAHWLYPGLGREAVLDRVLAGGPSLAVLTLGERGAILATPRGSVAVSATAPRVVDPVGAGDAFMGGLLHALLEGPDPRQVLERGDAAGLKEVGSFAARVAALTVGRPGADPPWRAAVHGAPRADAV